MRLESRSLVVSDSWRACSTHLMYFHGINYQMFIEQLQCPGQSGEGWIKVLKRKRKEQKRQCNENKGLGKQRGSGDSSWVNEERFSEFFFRTLAIFEGRKDLRSSRRAFKEKQTVWTKAQHRSWIAHKNTVQSWIEKGGNQGRWSWIKHSLGWQLHTLLHHGCLPRRHGCEPALYASLPFRRRNSE